MTFFIMIWAWSSLGFFALASGMEKHQKQIFLKVFDAKKTFIFTIFGWLILISTLVICLMAGAISTMLSYWIGSLTFSALMVGLTLSYYADHSKKIAGILFILGLISTAMYYVSTT